MRMPARRVRGGARAGVGVGRYWLGALGDTGVGVDWSTTVRMNEGVAYLVAADDVDRALQAAVARSFVVP
jgi:hypothetical protein